jgi:hypothetical protein
MKAYMSAKFSPNSEKFRFRAMLFSIPRSARELKVSSETGDLKHALMILRLEKLLATRRRKLAWLIKFFLETLFRIQVFDV